MIPLTKKEEKHHNKHHKKFVIYVKKNLIRAIKNIIK